MASNRSKVRGRHLTGIPTDGGVLSGDPGLFNQIPFVAEYNKDANNNVCGDTLGVYKLSVKGLGLAAANIAVAFGDIIYYVPGNTPKLSKASDGVNAVRYGYCATNSTTAVASGATTVIDVRLGY